MKRKKLDLWPFRSCEPAMMAFSCSPSVAADQKMSVTAPSASWHVWVVGIQFGGVALDGQGPSTAVGGVGLDCAVVLLVNDTVPCTGDRLVVVPSSPV